MEKIYLDQYGSGDPGSGWSEPDSLSEEQALELYSLIGKAIFMFNSVESSLDYIIADALNGRSRIPGYIVTAETNVFTKKVALFKCLLGIYVKGYSEEVSILHTSLVKELYKIKDVRNDIAHANWMASDENYRVKLRLSTDEQGVYAVIETLSPERLLASIDRMQSILENLEVLSIKLSEMGLEANQK
jgi:hypothetical protein